MYFEGGSNHIFIPCVPGESCKSPLHGRIVGAIRGVYKYPPPPPPPRALLPHMCAM